MQRVQNHKITGEMTEKKKHSKEPSLRPVIPPEALLTAEPEGAILVTAAGLYVQEVPQTSTFRSLSE